MGMALQFVLLLGAADLLADATYEGGRSVVGPFLALLGASGVAVGVLSGLGEMVGYGLRLGSGYLSDRLARPWAIALFGYALNLLAVPALALAGTWQVAAALMVAERAGRGLRAPARDLMLSHAASRIGFGWAFGLHEALDQAGAVAGPLLVALVLYLGGVYRDAFALLLLPALACLAILLVARTRYPRTVDMEVTSPDQGEAGRLPGRFWAYLLGAGLLAAGYVDFPLVAFHLEREGELAASWVPLLYTMAMGVDAVAALVLGRLFDRLGLLVVAASALLAAPFALLVFGGGGPLLLVLAMALWGTGMAAQESVLRAAVATMVRVERRGLGFGLFNSVYGVAWFAGSALLGLLYDLSIPTLVVFSLAAQVAAALVFLTVARAEGMGQRPPAAPVRG
jgi:predicted MFS family arabinose efflux permease